MLLDHKFPMKHLLHLSKLWIVCHFMSIQTRYVACIWRCFKWFLIMLCCIVVCSFFFLRVSMLWLIIPQFVQYLLVFLVLPCVFGATTCLTFCGTKSAFFASAILIHSSHNIAASLCCCNVDCFIPIVVILRYDYKPTLNTIVRKLSMVGTCKPWNNFWIHS
jgi:hypothetical protein